MTCVRACGVALALLFSAGPAFAEGEIRWYTDLKQASAAAQKADLPMFIDFWADWCAACNIMDKEVYTDASVIKAFEAKAIGVRVHYDLQPDVARRYEVPALPYLLFTDSYGTPLVHSRGLIEADDLANIINAMPSLATINQIDRALQENKNDFASLVAMGRAMRAAAFWEASNAFYDRASKHRSMKADAVVRESVQFETALNWLELQDGKKARTILDRFLKDFPKSTRAAEARAAVQRARELE